jgi:mono/diheme cytochrome c family protein
MLSPSPLPLRNKTPLVRQSRLKSILGIAALSITVLVSGCTAQKASVSKTGTLLSEPVYDQRLVQEDFAFPSQPPSLMAGRELYQAQCMTCHVQSYWQQPKVKTDLAYTTPIDLYLMLTTGASQKVTLATPERRQVLPVQHPGFREKINRDGRWAVIFYARYLAGAGDLQSPDPKSDLAAIFGGNCAVCHGAKGQGDGFLYTGKTGNHELKDAVQTHNLNPQPANFTQYNRVYNRTDAQLMKYLCEGIYPSAMPAWFGDVNVDKDTGKPTYIFDEKLLSSLTRYIRTKSYINDLKPDLPEVIHAPAGLAVINRCNPAATNRPWTNVMRDNGPNKGSHYVTPLGDPITGGMTHVHGTSLEGSGSVQVESSIDHSARQQETPGKSDSEVKGKSKS